MRDFDPNWLVLSDNDPFWVWNNIEPAKKPFEDIKLLLHWFDQSSITLGQLEDALEEIEYHNDIRYSIMAMRRNPLIVEEEIVEEK